MDASFVWQLVPSEVSTQGSNIGHRFPQGTADRESDIDELDTAANNLLLHLSMTTERVNLVKTCLSTLQRSLNRLGPDWRVAPFGSTYSGFCTCFSDLDATCYRAGIGTPDITGSIEELKLQLLPLLEQHPHFEVIEQIWSARVPILRLKYYGMLEVDLSCHNTEPLPNTYLLRAYSKVHPAVRAIVLVIKQWAKAEQISGAAEKNLSSYSITLLVIYFLLVTPGLDFPHVPTHMFSSIENKNKPPTTEMKWSPTQPLAMLIRGFFCFFAQEFIWGEEVVSVRVGKRLPASDAVYSDLRGRFDRSRLHVEDPYLVSRNLNCVLSQQQELVLRSKFGWVWQQLQLMRIPQSLSHVHMGTKSGKSRQSDEDMMAEHERCKPLGNPDSQMEMTNTSNASSIPLPLQSICGTSESQANIANPDVMHASMANGHKVEKSGVQSETIEGNVDDTTSISLPLQSISGASELQTKLTNAEDVHSPMANGHRVETSDGQPETIKGDLPLPTARTEKSDQVDRTLHPRRDTVEIRHVSGTMLLPECGQSVHSAPRPEELPIPITLFAGIKDVIRL